MKVIIIMLCTAFLFTRCQGQKPTVHPSEVAQTKDTSKIVVVAYDIDYIMGKFDPAKHEDFVLIPAKYRDADIRYIRKDVLDGFIKMYEAAEKDSIKLIIKSATRNFDNQKRIWENKWTGNTILEDGTNAKKDIKDGVSRARKILEYSSMPGTSRHHWGTDLDFNSFENEYFEKGEGLKLYKWMQKNAIDYGFCQPYTKIGTDRHSGYFEEKWHWTYMPVSGEITNQAKSKIKNEMISGFLGAETASTIDVVNLYILGISPSCMNLQD